MDRRMFIKTSGAVAAHTAAFSSVSSAQQQKQKNTKPFEPSNPFDRDGNWYKCALHVHTTTSDGDVDVPTRLKQYRGAGYNAVAVTDHWKTNDLTGFSDEDFLAINGMEFHPQTSTDASAHHFVGLDLPHPLSLDRDKPAQTLIDKVLDVGGKVIYAHPYWTAHTLEELLEVKGYIGVEVYNSHCDLSNVKGYSSVHIDQLLNNGRIIGLVGVDDIHKSGWIDHGWTMIKAKGLNKDDIMDAISTGSYYCSNGAVIDDCRIKDGKITLQCPPASEIRFLFNGAGGGRRYKADNGSTITQAEWDFSENRREVDWIRAEVIDENGKYAWTSPFVVT